MVFLMTQNLQEVDKRVSALIDGVSYDTKFKESRETPSRTI